ncbi:LBP_cg2779 family protein [Bombilactobacillus folatiphilus]|uniref:LBP_cg2779 family protein n=1 Tax=Bombilactobacillus folatiphilus TaxID=2923362 RepID=A0ABY4P7C3_9LACO|nr:LBP_cg2779 family protein [Bombilactobacillus folatiphilus]UQS81509.1 LBP_cg2779 family protein [Bombilactobacillus folatiphilus]
MEPSLATLIIAYQKKMNQIDTQFAFASHLPVEKIHQIKNGSTNYSSEDKQRVLQYINDHS